MGDTSLFKFCGIVRVIRPIRGRDHRKKLLTCELQWIFKHNISTSTTWPKYVSRYYIPTLISIPFTIIMEYVVFVFYCIIFILLWFFVCSLDQLSLDIKQHVIDVP